MKAVRANERDIPGEKYRWDCGNDHAIGVGPGLILGMMFDQIGPGIALGAALGLVFGSVADCRRKTPVRFCDAPGLVRRPQAGGGQ